MGARGHQTIAYDERMTMEAMAAFVTSRVRASGWRLYRPAPGALEPATAIEAGDFAIEDPGNGDWHLAAFRSDRISSQVHIALLRPGTQPETVLEMLAQSTDVGTIRSQAQLALSARLGPSGWKASLLMRGPCTGLLKAVHDYLMKSK